MSKYRASKSGRGERENDGFHNLRMPLSIIAKLHECGKANDRSVSEVMRTLIGYGLLQLPRVGWEKMRTTVRDADI